LALLASEEYAIPYNSSQQDKQIYQSIETEIGGALDRIDEISAKYANYSPLKKACSISFTKLESNALKYKKLFDGEIAHLEELIKQLLAMLSVRMYDDIQHVKQQLSKISEDLISGFESVQSIVARVATLKKDNDDILNGIDELKVMVQEGHQEIIRTLSGEMTEHFEKLVINSPRSEEEKDETVKDLKVRYFPPYPFFISKLKLL
jgi:hypothetical protein